MSIIERNEITEDTPTIEGVIYNINGAWVAVFNAHGENQRCQIDFCPWCGHKIKWQAEHTCAEGRDK